MEAIEGDGPALPGDATTTPNEMAQPPLSAKNTNMGEQGENHCSGICSELLTRLRNTDRRLCYLLGMLLSILHPIIALWVVTYKECPLDDLGKPIPNYEPPPPCSLDASGGKVDPDCIDPPQAYARIENICYMYLVNEFALHVTYVLYVKVWTLGGRSVGHWRELAGYATYFIVEFLVNAAPYHVQTFPAFRSVFPFLNHFTWPLYAAFIFGSILLIPLGVFLAKTRDQARRAVIFHLPGIVFFGVDVFNRTVFLPFFETMQHKFAQLELHDAISFIGELALANFYGSIFLPATHKATIVFAEFGYNVSYLTGRELPIEGDEPKELLQQESEEGIRVLLELDGPSSSDLWKQSSGLRLEECDVQNSPHNTQHSGKEDCAHFLQDERFNRKTETAQQGATDRNATEGHQRGPRTSEQQSRASRIGSKASTLTSATRTSRILAPIVTPIDYIPPSGPHVPIRPDGPDPLEFDKILCWLSIVWDAWRYLLIRTVLMKASSIFLYLLMVIKDFSFSYWHFGYSFMERRVLSVIEGVSNEDQSLKQRILHVLFKVFQVVVIRPFFLSKFLATTVWRTEVIFGMNEKRQNYSQIVYDDSLGESQSSRISFRETMKHAGGRKPTASDWATAFSTVAVEKGRYTRGWVASLFSDLWTHLVLNVRREWRHWRAKDLDRYKHPVEHWKKRLTAPKEERKGTGKQDRAGNDGLEVRYCFANECVIIRHVPPKPKGSKSRSSSKIFTRTEEANRPSGQSVFRRMNATWLSKVVKEIQSLIFNRCWPRLLQKLMASSVFLATELYTEHSIVSLLPSYQEVRPYCKVETQKSASILGRLKRPSKPHRPVLCFAETMLISPLPCSLLGKLLESPNYPIVVRQQGATVMDRWLHIVCVSMQFGLFKDTMGRFRVVFMFCIDIVEVSAVWYTQAQSRFYQSIKKGYNLFHNLPMILLCIFNCAAQIMNFAMLRYIRFAPICGDKRVLPDDVQQDMLKNLNLVKYWDQPEM